VQQDATIKYYKVNSSVIIKDHVICGYLGFNIVAIALLIIQMEGIKHICTWFYTMH
jgi:hypothetical protein